MVLKTMSVWKCGWKSVWNILNVLLLEYVKAFFGFLVRDLIFILIKRVK